MILLAGSPVGDVLAGLVGLVFLTTWLIFRRRSRRGLDISAGSDDLGRILLFSDAVIGIAITIVAAQIDFQKAVVGVSAERVQVQELFTSQFPLYYAIGFVVMGTYWLFHYRMFRYIKRKDAWLIVLNFWFLLCIAFMLIPITLYARYPENRVFFGIENRVFFGIWQTITALALVLIWRHAARKRRLLDHKITDSQIRRFRARALWNLGIFFVLMVVVLCFGYLPPWLYLCLYLALIVLAMLVVPLLGRRAQAQEARVV